MFSFSALFGGTKKRRYEGAARTRRTAGWFTGWGDANSQIKADLPTLRERSRELRRNNPWIAKGISVITNNVVGKGIVTQIDNNEMHTIWNEWTNSTSFDFDGRLNLKAMQRMVMDAVAESGEVLIRRRVTAGLKYPFQYQILESDYLDDSITKTPYKQGNFVIQGIEFDSQGRRVGYHIYESHPGSIDHPKSTSMKSNFIPSSEVIHVFRADRPGQQRGVPWPAPVMIKVKDLDDFEDAQLVRQKIAACFTAFVHDISSDVECEDNGGSLGERIEPGIIEHLPTGKNVTFADPPSVDNYDEFTKAQLRKIAAGLLISYESLTGDLTEVNFSSGRMGWIEMGRNIEAWREHLIIGQMLDFIKKDFVLMMSIIRGNVPPIKFTDTPPKREMIDPTKEIPAMIAAIRAGLKSRSASITSMGDDPEETNKQIQKDNESADAMGLIFDSDPRKVQASGKWQEVANDSQNGSDQNA